MGTHPIFESDFDCLTEVYQYEIFRVDVTVTMMETQQGDPQIMSQRNGNTHEVIFDSNDFNRNVLTATGGSGGGGNQNSGSEQRHPAVAVANQAGQIIGQIVPVSGGGHAVMLNQTVTQTVGKDWAKPQTTIQLKQEPNQTSVPKIPSGVDKFKQTHNQHEDLRRRASYRKIYEEINPVENGQSKHAMIDSFAGGPPTGLDRFRIKNFQSQMSKQKSSRIQPLPPIPMIPN